jgi:cobalt-zinc-cadmium efflux system membrane fusion protein
MIKNGPSSDRIALRLFSALLRTGYSALFKRRTIVSGTSLADGWSSMVSFKLCKSAVTVTALVASALLCACSKGPEQPSPAAEKPGPKSGHIAVSPEVASKFDFRTEPVHLQDIVVPLHLTGRIEPDIGKEVEVSTRISGRIERVLAGPGQIVKPTDQLAIIDSREITEIQAELIEAQAKLNIAKAHEDREKVVYEEQLSRPKGLIDAKTRFNQMKVQQGLAEAEFKRIQGLFVEKIAATKDFLVAQANLAKVQADYDQAVLDLQREQHLFENRALMKKDYQLAQAETARHRQHLNTLIQRLEFLGMTKPMIDQILKTGLISARIPIRAPIAGIVGRHSIGIGETVEPNKTIFTVMDLTNVLATADLPEADLRQVRLGDKVKVTVSTYPNETFDGLVSFISDSVDPQTRTVLIHARLPNPSYKLRSNMFAEIETQGRAKSVLACPKSAVQELEGRTVAFVSTPEGYQEKKVTTGAQSESYVEIKSGLAEGDQVVTQGSLMLKAELTFGH